MRKIGKEMLSKLPKFTQLISDRAGTQTQNSYSKQYEIHPLRSQNKVEQSKKVFMWPALSSTHNHPYLPLVCNFSLISSFNKIFIHSPSCILLCVFVTTVLFHLSSQLNSAIKMPFLDTCVQPHSYVILYEACNDLSVWIIFPFPVLL